MRKALVLLVFASCGSDAPSIPLDQYLAGRHESECSRLTRCGLFTSESICNAYFRRPSDAALIAAVDADKLDYDGAAARECLPLLAAITCDRTQRDARVLPPPCDRVFRGRVADGAACAFDAECKSNKCNAPSCTRDICCPGTCATTLASPVDGPCEVDAQCAANLYCHKSKTCRARIAENSQCDDARGCDFGLFCIGVTDLDPGTCRKLPLLGESCPYKLCAEINATCSTTTSKCVALGLPGAGCTLDTDCSPFAECNEAASSCIDTPTLGMACDVYCAGESWCNANVCVAPLEDGMLCSADNQCASTDCFEGPAFDQCNETAVCF